MTIRSYKPSDADALSALYRRSVEALGPRHYGAAQVAAWAALAPSPERLRATRADGRWTFVGVDANDRPLAFADLEPDGHIHYFYCAPEAAGSGIAGALYAALERRAREGGLKRLHVEASAGARGFFRRQGFAELVRHDFAISDGVAIHNFAMVKDLGAPDD